MQPTEIWTLTHRGVLVGAMVCLFFMRDMSELQYVSESVGDASDQLERLLAP